MLFLRKHPAVLPTAYKEHGAWMVPLQNLFMCQNNADSLDELHGHSLHRQLGKQGLFYNTLVPSVK